VGYFFWGELRHKKQAEAAGRLVEEMP